jgi:hypothetical protein
MKKIIRKHELVYFVLIILLGINIQSYSQTNTPVKRFGHTITKIGNDIYLYGGYTIDGKQGTLGGVWQWDYDQQEWSDKNPTNTPPSRYEHSASASNISGSNKMYVFFGGDGNGGTLANIWSYNPPSNSWTQETQTGNPVMSPRSAHSSSKLSDGRILVFGGLTEEFNVDGGTWIYNPYDGTWEKKADFPDMFRYGKNQLRLTEKYICSEEWDPTMPAIKCGFTIVIPTRGKFRAAAKSLLLGENFTPWSHPKQPVKYGFLAAKTNPEAAISKMSGNSTSLQANGHSYPICLWGVPHLTQRCLLITMAILQGY